MRTDPVAQIGMVLITLICSMGFAIAFRSAIISAWEQREEQDRYEAREKHRKCLQHIAQLEWWHMDWERTWLKPERDLSHLSATARFHRLMFTKKFNFAEAREADAEHRREMKAVNDAIERSNEAFARAVNDHARALHSVRERYR